MSLIRSTGGPAVQASNATVKILSRSYDQKSLATANLFLTDTMPRQIYLILLFRLPAMYFSRVARIFEDAEVSKPDIQRMINTSGGGGLYMDPSASRQATRANTPRPSENMSLGAAAGIGLTAHIGAAPASVSHLPLPFPEDWTAPLVSPALIRFKHSWEVFIDSLLREWKTLNVVSALLLSAILTTFQIPDAADDPLTRTAALLSLICALMSLCYGCMYIVRFGTMRSMYRASRWAEEARKTDTLIWWNVWVMLAMPAVWLVWSMVLFVVSILSFVWRTGSASDPSHVPLEGHAALGPRIAITGVFALGMVYFFMIVRTLKRYGVHVGGRGITSVGQDMRAAHNMNRPDAMAAALEMRGRPRERSTEGGRRRDGERNGTARKSHAQRSKELDPASNGLGLSLGIDVGGSPRNDSGIAIALEKGEH
ncbi:hypothetical protein BD779DRAFT_1671352 [Infundibulicybe gibba]|nr:hypothetical protein BD779DRAFT_1671352 [Infundibulicybe gibba]